jgi:type IV pilus assembly protein PilW
MKRPHTGRRLSRSFGFSLIELMVAMTIGLTLMGGLLTLFSATSSAGNELDKSIRQIENGRYAVELLTEDISVAGYYGELSTGLSKDWAYDASAACATPLTSTDNLGWNDTASLPKPIIGLSAAQADALTCLPHRKPGTAALVLHRLDTNEIAIADAVAGTFYVQTSRCAAEDLDDATYPRFIAGNALTSFTLTKADCATKNAVRKYINRIYYVAACDECAAGVADTIPTLKRAELVGGAFVSIPLVEGIDDIAFDYGVDTNEDGLPDQYLQTLAAVVPPNTPPNPLVDWGNVMSVRMHVLSRTIDKSTGYTDGKTFQMGLSGSRGPYTDNYKRRLSTITARLNNPAGARE